MIDSHPYQADAEFTHSSFGGGWLMPHNESGDDLAQRALGTDGKPEWPEGHIVEPYEMRELIEWAQVMGVAVAACQAGSPGYERTR